MNTIKLFWKIIKKNKTGILIYSGIMVAMMLVMTGQNADEQKKEYNKVDISFAVIDRDNSDLSEAIVDYLKTDNKLCEIEDDIKVIRNELFYRNVYYVLVIPENYEDDILSGKKVKLENYKVKASSYGYYMDMMVQDYIGTFMIYKKAGYDKNLCFEKTSETISKKVEVSMLNKDNSGNVRISHIFYHLMAYIMVALVLQSVGPVLVIINQKEMVKRINSSSTRFIKKNIEYTCASVVVCLIIWLILNIIGNIMFADELFVNERIYYGINSLCLTFISFSIVYLCGNLIKKSSVIGPVTNVISLGMSFLGGIFVPLNMFGKGMRQFAKVFPVYWYTKVNDMIAGKSVISHAQTLNIAKYMGVELLYAAVLFIVTLLIVKKIQNGE